jgi:anti-anti-sigma factor
LRTIEPERYRRECWASVLGIGTWATGLSARFEDGTLEIAASRNWPARAGTESIEASPRSHRAALGVALRALAASVGRSVRASYGQRSLGRPFETTVTGGPETSALTILRARYESGVHFIVSGELDIVTAPLLKQQCERLEANGAETVLLDLADLTTMDSSGLDVLFAAYAHFGERLVIIIGPPCAHTIGLANVRDWLPIIEG